ncbi:MAG: hypothetical protein MZW92_34115 [Comamonadaceae bacterium]|nr:hypothetical protein [Comamonadaceae bacterium]
MPAFLGAADEQIAKEARKAFTQAGPEDRARRARSASVKAGKKGVTRRRTPTPRARRRRWTSTS